MSDDRRAAWFDRVRTLKVSEVLVGAAAVAVAVVAWLAVQHHEQAFRIVATAEAMTFLAIGCTLCLAFAMYLSAAHRVQTLLREARDEAHVERDDARRELDEARSERETLLIRVAELEHELERLKGILRAHRIDTSPGALTLR